MTTQSSEALRAIFQKMKDRNKALYAKLEQARIEALNKMRGLN